MAIPGALTGPFAIGDLALDGGVVSTRDRIMSDPSLRLSFNLEQKKAQQQSEEVDVKRHTDSAVLPLILEDMRKNEAHVAELNQKITDFTTRQPLPAPVHQMATLGLGDLLGVGLAALSGGHINNALGAAYGNVQARNDNDFNNQNRAYEDNRQRDDQTLTRLQREYDQAQATNRETKAGVYNELGHRADMAHGDEVRLQEQKHSDRERAKDRFLKADNEGEVRSAADDLAKMGDPVSDQALEAAVKSSNLKTRKQDTVDGSVAYNAIKGQIDTYQGVEGPQADALDQRVSEINALYGTHFPPVIGGPTWKARNAEAELKYKAGVQATKEKQFRESLAIKDKEVTGMLANWASAREFRGKQLDIEQTRANAAALHSTDSRSLEAANSRMVAAKAQLEDVNSQIAATKNDASLTPSQKRNANQRLYSMQASLKTKVVGYEAALNYMNRTIAGGGNPAAGGDQTSARNGQDHEQEYNQAVSNVQERLKRGEIDQTQANYLWRRIKEAAGKH